MLVPRTRLILMTPISSGMVLGVSLVLKRERKEEEFMEQVFRTIHCHPAILLAYPFIYFRERTRD
jgi:hypothetical protein